MNLESLTKEEKERLTEEFHSYCKEHKLNCRNSCNTWDSDDNDCDIYGDSHPRYRQCYYAFVRWFCDKYKTPCGKKVEE